jgi:hypothetical protein
MSKIQGRKMSFISGRNELMPGIGRINAVSFSHFLLKITTYKKIFLTWAKFQIKKYELLTPSLMQRLVSLASCFLFADNNG